MDIRLSQQLEEKILKKGSGYLTKQKIDQKNWQKGTEYGLELPLAKGSHELHSLLLFVGFEHLLEEYFDVSEEILEDVVGAVCKLRLRWFRLLSMILFLPLLLSLDDYFALETLRYVLQRAPGVGVLPSPAQALDTRQIFLI